MAIMGQPTGDLMLVCANLEFQLKKCSAAPGGQLYPILYNTRLCCLWLSHRIQQRNKLVFTRSLQGPLRIASAG
jgi:hypothetical protein